MVSFVASFEFSTLISKFYFISPKKGWQVMAPYSSSEFNIGPLSWHVSYTRNETDIV
jgi:hypothetical protein